MEIDNILEEDLMAALDGMNMSDISSDDVPSSTPVSQDIPTQVEPELEVPSTAGTTSTTIDASSADIASLLKELLNNKTLEITIRVKDN